MRMLRIGFGTLVLMAGMATAAAAADAATVSAPEVTTPAPIFMTGCSAWYRTIYYSEASHTNWVGTCTITCQQYYAGSAEPTFTAGGACSGASSSFPAFVYTTCPCPQ